MYLDVLELVYFTFGEAGGFEPRKATKAEEGLE